jgi:tRNA (guanine-N7-)-methyltransferase
MGEAPQLGQSRAFFGRRKGHALKAAQSALLNTLLPSLALDLRAPPGALRNLYSGAADDVWLEIGFGSGEHLIEQARANPRIGFIGVEPYLNGMAKALSAISAHALSNIRLHHGDATDVLPWLPPASIARVYMLYPDPWPKRRHWKRRFMQDANIAALARVLQPGGEFRFVTDMPAYAAWTLRHMLHRREFEWTAERSVDWRLPWPGFLPTRYEMKARREGRTPCYLTFRRRDG